MEKLESNLVGVTGEYYVAAELSRRGYIASITLRNSRGIDIVASNSDASKSISVQVKTNSDGSAKWVVNRKSEGFYSANHFYIFVSLKPLSDQPPIYHVVPSEHVAKTIKVGHQNWLSGTKKDGSPRKDSTMRKFEDLDGKFVGQWQLLGL
ncbi:hypothetical protein ABMX65_21845 [Vibrio vulnificus]|uniref:hypothetical protein n=1 Tax=Vibrio vulnificus TaxID=672 RepID=UPI004059A8E1